MMTPCQLAPPVSRFSRTLPLPTIRIDLRISVYYIYLHMKEIISSTEAARNLGEYLARVRHRGERFVIVKNNKPIAELGPVSGSRETTLAALWAVLREVRADDDFAADLERVNAADIILENPWA